ncbi:MAG: hypothetical protein EG824_04830 [Deltaproteobacteria bacterium]|nr:hypothetical protein [Deltaproteobacteria bacterium]
MIRLITVMAIFLGLSGCATTRITDPYAQQQRRKLVLAQLMLADNRIATAKEILSTISSEPGVAGVTDEALFRLSLINLEAGEHKIATGNSGKSLEKLIKNYPSSAWKAHAVTLKGLMDAYDISLEEKADLEKTVRTLRNSNNSLTKENNSLMKDNKDLRQDLEKLKNLDLELEMKNKR